MGTNLGERRRYRSWPAELKREIVAASLEPGSSVSVVARRYDVNANQVFAWRKRYRDEGGAPAAVRLMPVTVRPDPRGNHCGLPAGKDIYRAVDAAAGEAALTAFDEGVWGKRYPAIGQSWRRAWAEVIPFYAFPADVRRILYTTNAIEALNSKLRRAVRARGHFPSDQAATKLLFLVLNRSEKEWIMPPREWCMAKAQFAVLFGERFTRAMA